MRRHHDEVSCDDEVGDDFDGDGDGDGDGDVDDGGNDDDCDGESLVMMIVEKSNQDLALWVAPGRDLIVKITAQNVAKSQNCCLKAVTIKLLKVTLFLPDMLNKLPVAVLFIFRMMFLTLQDFKTGLFTLV